MSNLHPDGIGEHPVFQADDRRMTAGIRVLLAATALAATAVDPSEPSRFVAFTYAALVLYLSYAALIYLVVRQHGRLTAGLEHLLPIVDVGAYAALIGLSGGSNSIYFILFFFGILTASFRGGLGYGVLVTAISVALFAIVGYLSRPPDPEFDLNRFLVRLMTLPVLGYLIAYRGGYERRLRRRLALLREISILSNPRFGPHHMLARALDQIRAFFDADLALAILPQGTSLEVRVVTRHTAGRAADPQPLPASQLVLMTAFEPHEVLCVTSRLSRQDDASGNRSVEARRAVQEQLGGHPYLTVPLRAADATRGRLYVSGKAVRFAPGDDEFLRQAADQLMSALSHVTLVERMATRAADDERQRIALDLHDRIIQPHIGLQLGLSAVEELAAGTTTIDGARAVRTQLRKLSELAALSMTDLRVYVQQLHGGPNACGSLIESLRRFAERFHEVTGIVVKIDADDAFAINGRLADELFSMVSEGVSNVRRHTHALSVRVEIKRSSERLTLRIQNPAGRDDSPAPFVPRSISGRAAAVSGTVRVESDPQQGTAVIVDIPL